MWLITTIGFFADASATSILEAARRLVAELGADSGSRS